MRRKAILLAEWLAVLGLVFSLTPFSFAQAPGKDRIVQAIDNSSRVTLQGNVRPMFRPENDMGPRRGLLQAREHLPHVQVHGEPAGRVDGASGRTAKPLFAELSPLADAGAVRRPFGLSQNDLNKVVAWLEAQGFTVTWKARSRTWVSFSGTASAGANCFSNGDSPFLLPRRDVLCQRDGAFRTQRPGGRGAGHSRLGQLPSQTAPVWSAR